jgi:hypothetical protein
MKIPCILFVAYYKFNGMHHCFIMKVKEILNRFFHVYAVNVTVVACVTIFLAYFIMLSPLNIVLLLDRMYALWEIMLHEWENGNILDQLGKLPMGMVAVIGKSLPCWIP